MANRKTIRRNNQRAKAKEQNGGRKTPRSFREREWVREYKRRMVLGHEYCRNCLTTGTENNPLSFDHLLALAKGGGSSKDNISILCKRCQNLKADDFWPELVSLEDEELGIKHGRHYSFRKKSIPFDPQELEKELSTDPDPRQVAKLSLTRFELIESKIEELERRLEALEESFIAGPPVKDDISLRAVDFLKQYPGIKFNTGTISANLGIKSYNVSDKLKSMADKQVIKTEKLEGHSAMFWYEEPKIDVTHGGDPIV